MILDTPQLISRRWAQLATWAEKVDIVSYNVQPNFARDYLWCQDTRLIVGLPNIEAPTHNAVKTNAVYAKTLYNWLTVRALYGSHTKLFIARRGKNAITAIVGSQNTGHGHTYELALEVNGRKAKELLVVYERLWTAASPIKPLDTEKVKQSLVSGEFGARG